MSRAKSKVNQESLRKNDVLDFLNFVARKAKADNVDQYFRNGKIVSSGDLYDAGKYFLTHALGCGEADFLPNINFKEFACYVPQSENYYPWVFFAVPTEIKDLSEFFDHHGRNYLLSADAGRKDYVVVTNFKTLSVFDFNHYQADYEVSLDKLYDFFIGSNDSKDTKHWANFVSDFGPEKVEERKKSRREEVVSYVEPKESSPQLQYVRRFGHMPSFEIPVGYDGQNFRDTFKTKELPFLTAETFDWDGSVKKVENRLIWGDNLSVMRSLPDACIDLIYIDPPFFSGRNYNCIFGDDDEVRSFKDIWDGGLPTYLAWMNARLWEMKRLLKESGQIFVHLDYHAVHYVKVELDKIFGCDNFRNEIVWHYPSMSATKRDFPRKHDTILRYVKSIDNYSFFPDEVRIPYAESTKDRAKYGGAGFDDSGGANYLKADGKIPDTVWPIPHLKGKERIGYPTQKPEALIERIIMATTSPGDTVADFFSGGGTTIAVAEKLNRRWLGVDISRIAVSVARDRIASVYNDDKGVSRISSDPEFGFSICYHGVYERDSVRELPEKDYRAFILSCYQAIGKSKGDYIHGFKDDKAIYVAPPKRNLRKNEIEEFHSELSHHKMQNGVILTWNVSKEAEKYVDELRKGANGPDIQIIQVKLVDIDSNEFKGDNIRFINKPAAVIKHAHQSGLTYVFDATASCGTNGSDIHYYQWDFNYKSRFSPHTKPNFKNDEDRDGNPLNDHKRFTYTFPAEGKFRVALRIFDKAGAEATHVIDLAVGKASKKAG